MRRTAVLIVLTAGLLVPLDAVSAQEAAPTDTTRVVATEAQYRDALADLSADDSGPHVIRLGADIQVGVSGGTPAYTGTQPLTIRGQGHTMYGAGMLSASGILHDTSHLVLTLEDLSVSQSGVGIQTTSSVVVRRSHFSDINTSPISAFGLQPPSLVVVSGSTFIANRGYPTGGAISSSGRIIVTTSAFRSNRSRSDGAALWAKADIRVDRSTISNNTSRSGAIVYSRDGDVTLLNSTVSGNLGLAVGGGGRPTVRSGDRLTLDHTTIAGNHNDGSREGASALSAGTLTSRSSVVQHDRAACFVEDTVSSGSRSSDPSCGFTGPNRGVLGNPRLGPLRDNGGQTLTRRPQPTSALIDAVPCRAAVRIDQRGVRRPQGPRCDIGAVEGR